MSDYAFLRTGFGATNAALDPGAAAFVKNAHAMLLLFSEDALRPVQRVTADKSKLYIATHDRTQPPASQVVRSDAQNVLLRQFHARNDAKRHKRSTQGLFGHALFQPTCAVNRARLR